MSAKMMTRKMILCPITDKTKGNLQFELEKSKHGQPMMWTCPKSSLNKNCEAFAFVERKTGRMMVCRIIVALDDVDGGRPHWSADHKGTDKARVILAPAVNVRQWSDYQRDSGRTTAVGPVSTQAWDMPSNWYV